MKRWLDDLRKAPAGYTTARSDNEAKRIIEKAEAESDGIICRG